MTEKDHCRIGSLESHLFVFLQLLHDHCRIGSLETDLLSRQKPTF